MRADSLLLRPLSRKTVFSATSIGVGLKGCPTGAYGHFQTLESSKIVH